MWHLRKWKREAEPIDMSEERQEAAEAIAKAQQGLNQSKALRREGTKVFAALREQREVNHFTAAFKRAMGQ